MKRLNKKTRRKRRRRNKRKRSVNNRATQIGNNGGNILKERMKA